MSSQAAVATCHPRRHHKAGESYRPTCRCNCSPSPRLIDCCAPYAALARDVHVGRRLENYRRQRTPRFLIKFSHNRLLSVTAIRRQMYVAFAVLSKKIQRLRGERKQVRGRWFFFWRSQSPVYCTSINSASS